MALATKCPHCNTTFRVAHDQLKLRGGIVRCGACNEVFDGNAALVDPAPRTPVIIDLPEARHDATPPAASAMPAPAQADSVQPEAATDSGTAGPAPDDDGAATAEALPALETLTSATPLPEHEAGHQHAPAPEAAVATADAPQSVTEPEPEPDFDLDLNGDDLPAPPTVPVLAAEPTAALPALAGDDAFDLDLDVDHPAPDEVAAPQDDRLPETWAGRPASHAGDHPSSDPLGAHANAALQAGRDADAQTAIEPEMQADMQADMRADDQSDALRDPPAADHRFDGRREPTLDIPDDHLAAVALHDSFELDAYPPAPDGELHSTDERGHTLDGGVWRSRGDRHHLGDDAPAVAPAAPLHSLAADHAALPGDDDDDDDIVTLSAAGAAKLAPEPSAPATPVSARAPEEPGFVKRSRRQEQWGKASRIVMACALPLLLAGLAYQAVATFRNPLAAAVPALKPALVSACALAGCKVELPSQLDALSIEQGELQTMADNIFSFSTSLRNQSPTAQNWPHIELILNDSADKPVLRRVFAPRDYLPAGADFASGFLPRSEQPVKLYFELSRVKASGYHIAVFYP